MTQWARAPEQREQMVLFASRLDDVLPADHAVRLLDEILGRVDWRPWEAAYHVRLGQPAIHPRVLAGVLLYGMLTRIRSSRMLEEALLVRLDFRWLAEGRQVDHTTLSEFRRKHGEALKHLFVEVVLVARELGLLSLQQLGFDGTRIRANNRRSGTRTPQDLQRMREELGQRFAELEARLAAQDAADEETFGPCGPSQLPDELADATRRLARVDAALAELERVASAGETVPKRIPLTDPHSRLTPNKEGGFAPNYTPLATVDVESGLIVSADVIAMTNEDEHLVAAIANVQEQFGLDTPPPEMLADGMMATGANLAALGAQGVTLYSPIAIPDPAANPALREDPTQPVPQEHWDRLPLKTHTKDGQKTSQLDKSAFVYDAGRDCYWCPQGQRLEHRQTTSEKQAGGRRVRRGRYKADKHACGTCPLRERCLSGKAQSRQVDRDEHESRREELARRMATPEGQAKYKRRRHAGERPFAMIKGHFGARRFLLRGLGQVRIEWQWMAVAFNLHRLMSLIRGARAGPAPG